MAEPGLRGRYAPSPTGEIHLGNASTALLAWLSVRASGGTFVMRMEDIDLPRVRPGMDRRILEDLAWLGIDWDEGPDNGGPYAPYDQSHRSARHDDAFDRLMRDGHLYPCFCSRKDIAAAASAPQSPGEELRYPATCRGLDPDEARKRTERGDRHAWRLAVPSGARPVFDDRVHGRWGQDVSEAPGDFVVKRSDGLWAYHLAVVVDDIDMAVTEVVRGDDLLSSTTRHLQLYEALGRPSPAYAHVPLLLGTDRVRLSKRHAGTTLRELREDGFTPERIVGRLVHLLGLRPTPEPVNTHSLIDGFDLSRIRPAPGGLIADPTLWP